MSRKIDWINVGIGIGFVTLALLFGYALSNIAVKLLASLFIAYKAYELMTKGRKDIEKPFALFFSAFTAIGFFALPVGLLTLAIALVGILALIREIFPEPMERFMP